MTCVRHLQRLWTDKTWGKLLRELLADRPERSPRLETDLHSMVAAAALAMIRLDELGQSHVSLFGRLLRTILASQESDGGWRDPMTTALCLRALTIDRGQGLSIDRGLAYLGNMQKSEGCWPREPLRRLPGDGFASAYILFQLAHCDRFAAFVDADAAVEWLRTNSNELDGDARRLWSLAALHYGHPASTRRHVDAALFTAHRCVA
jgi:hypothetical protein